jgi:hypothetical protein
MKYPIRGMAVSLCVLLGLAGCLSAGRGHGPLDSFAFLSGTNKGLTENAVGMINERAEPQEVRVVVPAGTDLHGLVATLSLNKEAAITVISSGSRVVQQNGVTANDFSVPVIYAVEVPGDKKPWSYKVFVRVADNNAQLSQLILPQGSFLRPPFNGAVHSYALEVPFATTTIRIGGRGESPYMKSITINGALTPGATGAANVDFQSMQERSVTIETLAEDGVTRAQYALTVRRGAPDTNAFLDALDLQNTALLPAFSPEQLGYQALVPFGTSQLIIHARPQSRVASVSLAAAQSVGGGSGVLPQFSARGDPATGAGAAVDLPPGPGIAVVVTVTAEDGTVRQYLLDVRRAPPDHNADLASLSISAGALNPPFSPRLGGYSVTIPASAENVTVTAVAASPVASVAVAERPGVALAPGQGVTVAVASGGAVLLTFVVRAEDGFQRVYRVQVNRPLPPPDDNALLQTLQVTGAQILPGFDPSVILYDARVPSNAESVAVQALAQSRFARVAIDGQPAGTVGRTVAVPPGRTRIVTIEVTAQNGTAVRYTLRVTRDAAGTGTPGTTQPGEGGQQSGGQPAAGPLPPLPPDSGRDHVVVTAKNLRLGAREATALQAAGDQVGTVAQISVRSYRTNDLITRYSAAVDVRQQGPNITLSITAPSNGIALKRDRLVEVETAIATKAGRFLFYTEAQDADDEVRVDLPFLLYGASPRVTWPALGTPVAVQGYLSSIPPGKERAMDKEVFDRNPKGELAISVEILDARSKGSYGKDVVLSRQGPRRERVFSFGKPIPVPEGVAVQCILTATAKNGKVWMAVGQAQVWTTAMAYQGGFQPVVLPVADDLEPGK